MKTKIPQCKAAKSAPSAGNEHFNVLTDRALLDEIPKFHPYSAFRNAQAGFGGVLFCGDPSLEEHAGYPALDCSTATEALLLAVPVKGLGVV